MRTLSPIASETMFRNTVRLPRDYYVRVFTNDYSVDPSMIGRLVDVSADLDTVTVSHDGLVIASRERVWARQLAITDPDHVIKAALLRKQFQILTSRWPRPNGQSKHGISRPHEQSLLADRVLRQSATSAKD